jgi:hypothetical protein
MQQWNKGLRRKNATTWEELRGILSDIQDDLITGDRNLNSWSATGLRKVNEWIAWRGGPPPMMLKEKAHDKEKSVHLWAIWKE